jgi:hypothetical protein
VPFTALIDALRARDRDALGSLLADSVVFNSPVATYEGRAAVVQVLGTVAEVVDGLAVDRVVSERDETVAFLSGRIGEHEVDGVLDCAVDGAGRIVRVTLMLRPLEGLLAGVKEMGRRLGG